jgi:stage III sporulation protein AB
MLETEICYSATPLIEAFRTVARHSSSRVAEIFADAADRLGAGEGVTAGEALSLALQQNFPKSALQPTDAEILVSLGAVLGASDRDDQKKHLALARERLKREEAAAQEARWRYERLYRYAGALGGAALVLLLI